MLKETVRSYLGIEQNNLIGILLEVEPSGFSIIHPWMVRDNAQVTRCGRDFRDPYIPVEYDSNKLKVKWLRGEAETTYTTLDKENLLKVINGKKDGDFVVRLTDAKGLTKGQKEKFLELVRRGVRGAVGNR